MDTTYINNEDFIKSKTYQEFMKENPGTGGLTIRTYAASQAIPISGVRIVISKVIDDITVIFFDGQTDNSGMIEDILLPAPAKNLDDLNAPITTKYELTATYAPDNIKFKNTVNMYDGIKVLQNINIVPDIIRQGYLYYGS